mmetsp:Transcript_12794/g.19262  ORF Transcript_12794/g.19262 Transcript_12794/m.19262 type:complete len:188 (-) Transcript_12794:71-634(-)
MPRKLNPNSLRKFYETTFLKSQFPKGMPIELCKYWVEQPDNVAGPGVVVDKDYIRKQYTGFENDPSLDKYPLAKLYGLPFTTDYVELRYQQLIGIEKKAQRLFEGRAAGKSAWELSKTYKFMHGRGNLLFWILAFVLCWPAIFLISDLGKTPIGSWAHNTFMAEQGIQTYTPKWQNVKRNANDDWEL